jgi:hypothetical protein
MTREEALAKAREFHNRPSSATPAFEREAWERTFAERLLFEADLAEWLKLRAADIADRDFDNERQHLRSTREDDLILSLLTTPAVLSWMVYQKFEVIEYVLAKFADDKPSWNERIAIIALAGIKTDLMRFGIGNKTEGSTE